LTTLEPALLPQLGSIAELYAIDGGRIGRTVRPADVLVDGPLTDEALATLAMSGDALFALAEDVGKDLAGAGQVQGGVLPPVPLLSELNKADFMAVLATVSLVRKRPGEKILVQGEPGQSFFLVARGEVEVVRTDEHGQSQALAVLQEGAIVGEMALLSRAARSADVRAKTDADLLELSVEALSQVSRGADAIARALEKFTRERLIANLLNTAPLFRPLQRTQRIDLVRRFVAHDVAASTDLIREGEPGRGLYVLLTGAVDVWKRDGEEKLLLATLGPGDVFGEISLLSGAVATATVSAAQRSTVLFLGREYVEKLIQTVPALRTYLEQLGDEREMETRMWLASPAAVEDLSQDIDVEWVE
jgi:cAMP-dependent protein kinase regulator